VIRKATYLIVLLAVTTVAFLVNSTYYSKELEKLFFTLLALSVVYLVLNILIGEMVSGRIKDSKARYSFKKTIFIISIASIALAVVLIWVEDSTALLVSYGLIGAGLAIALQDVFKNFAGGIIILTSAIYRVGDRIDIQSTMGDVIDVGIMYTTLLEIRKWVNGDQATGRLVSVPNGVVISTPVVNFTRDHSYLWDEIMIPVTYDSDWRRAGESFKAIVRKETELFQEGAQGDIDRIEEKYYIPSQDIEPNMYVVPTDNWIALHLRYVVPVRQRRIVRDRINRLIIDEVEKSEAVRIASESIDISSFPLIRYSGEEPR
jgi:small-conductance mechanosensitive channel